MKKQMHRLLSLMLSLILVVGLIPGTMTAHAADGMFTVTATASPADGGTITGAGEYQYNSTPTLTAIPARGYKFAGWYKAETDEFAWSNKTMRVHVDGDLSYIAKFVKVPGNLYDVTFEGENYTYDAELWAADSELYAADLTPDVGYVLDKSCVKVYIGGNETQYGWSLLGNEAFRLDATYITGDIRIVVTPKVDPALGYTVTFDANGGNVVTPASVKTDPDGKLTTLPKATHTVLYMEFDGWYTSKEGGEKVTTSTVFTQDTTIYAHWNEKPFSVQVIGGTSDKHDAKVGETVTITADSPISGMKFAGWTTESGVEFADASAATTTFVMPAWDVRVDATYENLPATYHVTVVGGTADKEAAGENKYKAEKGETITITAYDAPDGKKFVGWQVTVNDMFVDVDLADATAKETTFEMPEGNVRVDAVFEDLPATYHVTVEGGTADKYEAEEGETITITANAPGSNQKFVGWTVVNGDGFIAVELTNASAAETTFTMPNGNVMVKANFEEIESYHVTVVGGTADKETAGENKYKAEPGETIKITAYAPGSNQKFVGWKVTVNDMFVAVELADASAAETTFTMPNGNVRVDAVFEDVIPSTYKVQVVGGTADKTEYAPGETVTITAYPPASDMQFAKWTTEDGVTFADATKATTTFVMPAKDVRVDATYEDEVPDKYSVQVVGGNADRADAKYAPGETVTITAYPPASDMQFAKWTTEDGVTFADATKSTTTFVMPAKDVRVDATYEDEIPSTYKVQVVGGNADKTEYAPGETVTITAYPPASDKQFAKWTTEDGVTFADATKATTTFVMPAKDVRVDATYEDEVPAGELDDIPKTGDPMDLVLWGSLAMISAMAAAALIILQKKRVF